MKPAAGGGTAAGGKAGGDDRKAVNKVVFSETNQYIKDVKQLKPFKDFIEECKTKVDRNVVMLLENANGAYDAPKKVTFPDPVEPEELVIPEEADANVTAQLQESYRRQKHEYSKELNDQIRFQATQNQTFLKQCDAYEASQQAGWIWLRKYVNSSILATTRTLLKETANCQLVFKNLLEFSEEEAALSDFLERKRLTARANAFFLNPRIKASGALEAWFMKWEEYVARANLDEDSVLRKIRAQFTGVQYTPGDGIKRAMFDMLMIEGLTQDKTYEELKEALIKAYKEYIIIVKSHGDKVIHELTEVRKQVELEDKARALAYHRDYADNTVTEDITLICGTCNMLSSPRSGNAGKSGGDNSTPTANSKSKREKKCLRCFGPYHKLEECESEKCASCLSLSAQQHKDRKCPLFKYVVRYYLDHGVLPRQQNFFADYDVPEAIFKLCFPKAAKFPSKNPDNAKAPVQGKQGGNASQKKSGNKRSAPGAQRPASPSP